MLIKVARFPNFIKMVIFVSCGNKQEDMNLTEDDGIFQ